MTNPTLAGMAETAKAERERWSVGYDSQIPTYFAETQDFDDEQFLSTRRYECESYIEAQGQRAALQWLVENVPLESIAHMAFEHEQERWSWTSIFQAALRAIIDEK